MQDQCQGLLVWVFRFALLSVCYQPSHPMLMDSSKLVLDDDVIVVYFSVFDRDVFVYEFQFFCQLVFRVRHFLKP